MQHAAAREAFRLLTDSQPEIGGCCQIIVVLKKTFTNPGFKHGPQFTRKNENTMLAESLARKPQNNNLNDFWKKVKVVNNTNAPLTSGIDGVSSPEKIAEVLAWAVIFTTLLQLTLLQLIRNSLNLLAPLLG